MSNGRDNTAIIAGAVGLGLGALLVFSTTARADSGGNGKDVIVPPVTPPEQDNVPPQPLLQVRFSPRYITGQELFFTGEQSTDPDGVITEYWIEIFNSRGVKIDAVNNNKLTTTINKPGTYTVVLTVKDNDGAVRKFEGSPLTIRQRENTPKTIIASPPGFIQHFAASRSFREQLIDGNNEFEGLSTGFQTSNNYRGADKYVYNRSGEMLPQKPPIEEKTFFNPDKDIESLEEFIRQGGVFIDYCGWAMLYEEGAFSAIGLFQKPKKWNTFCEIMQIPELGIAPGFVRTLSQFNVTDLPNYQQDTGMVNSLWITGSERPSPTKFIPETTNANVPFDDDAGVYSMFALRRGTGFYFYSNRFNNPKDYFDFIMRVHG